jgi:hypothetical protein
VPSSRGGYSDSGYGTASHGSACHPSRRSVRNPLPENPKREFKPGGVSRSKDNVGARTESSEIVMTEDREDIILDSKTKLGEEIEKGV